MSGTNSTPEATDAPITRLAVVGAGLVGGSVALAAMAVGVEQVVVTDASGSVRRRARELGLGHEVRDSLADTVADADLVVVAIPSRQVPPVMEEVAKYINMHSIVTDAASLKSQLVPEVEHRFAQAGGPSGYFVGGHPMAGSEASGPDAADGKLFQGATWVLTPTARTHDVALRRLSGFLSRLGARVLVVSPERHDRLVAVVSHLPQVAASCLADVAADAVATSGQAVLAVAGGGFRDTTRIAASDPDLWLGILGGNREAVLEVLEAYRASLDEVASALAAEDDAALRAKLERASEARRRLVPKDGPREVVDLVVALEDQPGALASVTGVLGEAGINIEDLAMRHAAAGERGALLVRVEATAAQRGLRVLRDQGLAAHLERDAPGGGQDREDPGASSGA